MSEKLKPCPFCGGEAKLWEVDVIYTPRTFWEVYCDSCNASIDRETHSTRDSAITAWNTRTANADDICNAAKDLPAVIYEGARDV